MLRIATQHFISALRGAGNRDLDHSVLSLIER